MTEFIAICLDDHGRYVQSTRRRFSREEAEARLKGICPSRYPVVVEVPALEVDGVYGAPVRDEEGRFIPKMEDECFPENEGTTRRALGWRVSPVSLKAENER